MHRLMSAALAAAAALAVLPDAASANLLRSRNKNATLSSLSNQLLAQPASAAGRRRNVWDADPPDPALNGFHYFLYNIDANGVPLGEGNESLTVKAISPGPGYVINSAEVLISQGGSTQPFFSAVPVNANNSYDPTGAFADFTQFVEFGVVRVNFSRLDSGNAGQISGSTDSGELAYTGDLVNGERGVEHFRIFTETRIGHDNDVPRGVMTTVVPLDFVPGTDFANGFLDFGNNDVAMGGNVTPAPIYAVTPEPAALTVLGAGVGMLMRRRRTGRPAVA